MDHMDHTVLCRFVYLCHWETLFDVYLSFSMQYPQTFLRTKVEYYTVLASFSFTWRYIYIMVKPEWEALLIKTVPIRL